MTEPEWRRVREGLGSLGVIAAKHHIQRSRLAWRFEASKKGTDLFVRADEAAEAPLAVLRDLERLYEAIVARAKTEGLEIRPYKPLEAEAIVVAAEVALAEATDDLADQIGRLLHELIWAQGLPNGNHRSTFALVELLVREQTGRAIDPQHTVAVAESFVDKSKPLIVEKEFQPDPAGIKRQHLAHALVHAKRLLEGA